MQMAIDAHRLSKGHSWGSLFWQYNDCWPGPSWSAVDVFGREKVLYEKLEILFAPVAVIPKKEGDELQLVLVNDRLEEFNGTLIVQIENDLKEEQEMLIEVSCEQNGIVDIQTLPIQNISHIRLELRQGDRSVFRRVESF